MSIEIVEMRVASALSHPYIEGMSYEQIGAYLAVPAWTLRVLPYAAKQALKESLPAQE